MNPNHLLYIWIGKQVAKYRKEKNLSQSDLANLTNLSRGSIANIEKGRQQTPLHVLWNVAEQLGVKMNQIIPLKNEHITKNTSELINQVNEMEDLKDNNKKVFRRFFENKF